MASTRYVWYWWFTPVAVSRILLGSGISNRNAWSPAGIWNALSVFWSSEWLFSLECDLLATLWSKESLDRAMNRISKIFNEIRYGSPYTVKIPLNLTLILLTETVCARVRLSLPVTETGCRSSEMKMHGWSRLVEHGLGHYRKTSIRNIHTSTQNG